ncbi:MAG: hypothetical protein NZZ41_04215 [Candidatus Dojkabacteria bacterium]|nr:hypothetical protein [Candidatus Dojkabacteria bacterium]
MGRKLKNFLYVSNESDQKIEEFLQSLTAFEKEKIRSFVNRLCDDNKNITRVTFILKMIKILEKLDLAFKYLLRDYYIAEINNGGIRDINSVIKFLDNLIYRLENYDYSDLVTYDKTKVVAEILIEELKYIRLYVYDYWYNKLNRK